MARAIISALNGKGFRVDVTSDLRCFEPKGSSSEQAELITRAAHEVDRLIALAPRKNWAAWVTYHNYYKAPDLIGPAVAAALNIPYVLIEATRAQKRLNGPWDAFAKAAEAACDAADAIFYLTERDAQALRRDAPDGQKLVHLHPFLDRPGLPLISTHQGGLLSVGMMRKGDKLASYQLIAQTLALLPSAMQHIDIVGDGAARADVESLFAPFGTSVTFHGALDADGVEALYAQAKILFWPGVNEAFGMTYLEAQAAGVPVVAQDRPGVCDVTYGVQPKIAEGAGGMARAIKGLMAKPDYHLTQANGARTFISNKHLRPTAQQVLHNTLHALIKDRA